METIFPEGNGFAGFFLIGFRKDPDPPGKTQRVGTVILKRTYDIHQAHNLDSGWITPKEDAFPIFDQDQPDMAEQIGNLVENGDFEDEDISMWLPESGATVAQVKEPGGSGEFMLQVIGNANKKVTQTLTMPEALAGHKFTVTFAAKKKECTEAANITVELRVGTTVICSKTAELATELKWFGEEGRWPNAISSSEMQIVLRSASVNDCKVFYDDVSVFSRIRFEHDLVPFKPEGDVIVLDCLAVTGLTRFQVKLAETWQTWLKRTVSSSDFDMFGWEPRAVDPRKSEAAFSEDDSQYPLPSGFNNRFYNGYRRDALQLLTLPYFKSEDHVRIRRLDPNDDYGFTLGSEMVTAQVHYYRGHGPDGEHHWLSQNVPVVADTLVIEPEKNRCSIIWRGVWDFDAHPDEVYRKLVVSVIEPQAV